MTRSLAGFPTRHQPFYPQMCGNRSAMQSAPPYPTSVTSSGGSQSQQQRHAAESALIVALLLLCAVPVSAQTSGEKAADWISTGLVGVNLTASAIHDVKHHCVKNLLLRNGLTLGAAELTKVLVHEDRPDHSDAKSFYSEHSALAMANYGWSYQIGFSIAVGAGAGRIAAEKHHPVDVLVGLAAGLGASYLFPCEGR